MKIKDLKISVQLRLGLAVILLLVTLLATLAWVQTDILWQQTKGLYEHPHQIRAALDALRIDILTMHRDMRELCLAENDPERETIVHRVDIREAEALQRFDILYDRYLGPREDIDATRNDFIAWKSIRAETIRLLRAGKAAEAAARTKSSGIGGRHADTLLERTRIISDFARNKGTEFYRKSERQAGSLKRQLTLMVVIILVLTSLIARLLFQATRIPLADLTAAADQFRRGRLNSRSSYTSANEWGRLSTAFNSLADTVQQQIQAKESAVQLAKVMLGEEEAHGFCQELLKALLTHTDSQVGAVYFLNGEGTVFEHFYSIGLREGSHAPFSAAEYAGEFGPALATRQIQRVTNIPVDTCFTWRTVSGDFQPREILTIPILADHHVTAIVSLAAIHAFSTPALRLVDDIWSVLNARMNGILAFQKIQELAGVLKQQNQELDAQKREMAAQSTELNEQNSELAMQKRQLSEANRLKSAFLSNMSHELRTPLNSVIVLSGLLNRRLAKAIPEEEYSYLEIIERNGKNLLALINDILDLSRIEAGREEFRFSRFSLRSLTGEIIAMLETQAREKGIALINEVDSALPAIVCDADKCRHILQNLVANAVKFTEKGQVTISARQENDDISIDIADTGIGISAEHLPFIFEEFRQADDSTSRKYGGTGLGLAIAMKYALLLGGGITVASTPGQGSSFSLRLPLETALPGAPEETETSGHLHTMGRQPSAAEQGRAILLVEDSEPAIIQMKDILQERGYQVQVARNGREALTQLETSLPDAMILDLMMPEVDGFQVLAEIRRIERTAPLPVLILTARHVSPEELSFLKGNHIYQLIQKGDIDRTGLLAAVAGMIGFRQEVPAQPPPRARRPLRPGRPIVLVVEDNPDNLRTARALLQEDYQVIEAADGQAGIEQARLHLPDIILTDIAMPVMDGIEILGEIRRNDTLRDIPVIAVTSSAMSGDREAILAHGFDGYISKPIEPRLLADTLRHLLKGREGDQPENQGQGDA